MSSNGPQIFLKASVGGGAHGASDVLYEFDEFRLDESSRVLLLRQDPVPLTAKALDTLLILVKSEGRLLTKDNLMKAVWPDSIVEESNLTQTIFMLRKALGQTRDQGYIVTVPGRGYRFVADVRQMSRDRRSTGGAPAVLRAIEFPAKKGTSRLWRWPSFLGIATVLLIAGGVYFQWFYVRRLTGFPGGRSMLAVLPFQNLTGDPGQDYFSDGMTEELTTELGNLDPQHLGVIARTSVMHYKGSPVSLEQIGRELGVHYVIEGSVRRDSDRVRISAQLIQMKDQSHVWARQYDRELKDLLGVQAEIAQEIADEIHLTLGDQRKLNAARRTAVTSYEAYDLYLKGLYFWNQRTAEGFQKAAYCFQQAIAKDPNYARAYAGLANTFGLMSTWSVAPQSEFMPKARAAALKALDLDEALAEAHTALALVAENYDYDWQTAEKEFRRAIQLNPGYATAHQWYAECLSWQGRFHEALAESEEARKLDPLSLIIATDHGAILYFARQYDRAVDQLQSVLDRDPSFGRARALVLLADVEEHRYAEALKETDLFSTPPLVSATKAYVYGRWGRTAEAQQALMKSQEFARQVRFNGAPSLLMAYIGAGKNDEAIAQLQKAYDERGQVVVLLKVNPMFDPLRSDPRFQQLLAQVFKGQSVN